MLLRMVLVVSGKRDTAPPVMVNSRILPAVQVLELEPFHLQHPGGERDSFAFENLAPS